MPVSLDSQLATLRRVAMLRPTDMARAGLSQRASESELIHQHLQAMVKTFELIASDHRVRSYIEKNIKPT